MDDVESLMAVKIQDVVRANLVLLGLRLINTPNELQAFKSAVSTDVQVAGASLVANIPTGVTEPGRVLTLNRDRITLDLSPSRAAINRDYPERRDLRRLAEVAWQAINTSSDASVQPQAFGFNIELIFDQDSGTNAFGYLSGRLFDVEHLGITGWQFVGGAGRLIFDDSGRRWTINLEPRFNDNNESRVFLGVNLHIGGQTLLDEAGIRLSLEEVWDNSRDFVRRLHEGRDRHV